jgi:hypothetical protein
MSDNRELLLVIQNEAYDEFNGFNVRFVGFEKVPYPFSPRGWPRGKRLLIELKKALGDFGLTILSEGNSSVNPQDEPTSLVLSFTDFRRLYRSFWQISELCEEKAMNESMNNTLPGVFGEEREIKSELPEDIRNIIPSRAQLQTVNNFLRDLNFYNLREQDTLAFFTGGSAFYSLHLGTVLNEFESKLEQDLKEEEWQKFFEKNMLVLNRGYTKLIPKAMITPIAIEIPDFLLVSIEGYVDVYEIKLPKTELLKFDRDHNMYYWSSDMAKALAQTENYISSLDGNRASLERKIQQKFGMEVSILKPRGYVIAGHSNQLSDPSRRDGFRILNESLRNTYILPYDRFLKNFQNLAEALQDRSQ